MNYERFLTCVETVLQRFDKLPRQLKPPQLESLWSIVCGKDTFAILPTGYGKSLIFYILPFIWEEFHNRKHCLVLVVSPLVQLISSQIKRLEEIGISARLIGDFESDCLTDELVSFYYGGPEAFLASRWREFLKNEQFLCRIVALVIDEVHCVVEWYGCQFFLAALS